MSLGGEERARDTLISSRNLFQSHRQPLPALALPHRSDRPPEPPVQRPVHSDTAGEPVYPARFETLYGALVTNPQCISRVGALYVPISHPSVFHSTFKGHAPSLPRPSHSPVFSNPITRSHTAVLFYNSVFGT